MSEQLFYLLVMIHQRRNYEVLMKLGRSMPLLEAALE
jgi:hypothetical protein